MAGDWEHQHQQDQLRTDAERYRFIRDNLAQAMDSRMDGTFVFRVRSPQGRGESFGQVIDNMRNSDG